MSLKSSYNQAYRDHQTFGGVGPTESVLVGQLDSSVPWDAIPGTQIRVGLAGQFRAGTNPITLRVRLGSAPPASGSGPILGGFVALEVVIPALTTVDLAEISDAVAKPSGVSAFTDFSVTYFAGSGVSSLEFQAVVASILPVDGDGLGVYLKTGSAGVPQAVGDEALIWEWLVDFDQFVGVDTLIAGFSVETHSIGGVYRLRIGGAVGQPLFTLNPDGVVVASWTNDLGNHPVVGGNGSGGAVASVPNTFSGVLPVKWCTQGAETGHVAVVLQEG